jgi:LRR receptor-like serine/threonine-protein kinase FLS2
MYGNSLSGQIPTELGRLTRLLSLDLSENKFAGTLPTELDLMTHLAIFSIHQTSGGLVGPLPAFDAYPKLKELNLESNSFEGQIPDNFLAGIEDKTEFITVTLGFNQLTGSIPTTLDEFSVLNLRLEGNQITRCVNTFSVIAPYDIGSLPNLAS